MRDIREIKIIIYIDTNKDTERYVFDSLREAKEWIEGYLENNND